MYCDDDNHWSPETNEIRDNKIHEKHFINMIDSADIAIDNYILAFIVVKISFETIFCGCVSL